MVTHNGMLFVTGAFLHSGAFIPQRTVRKVWLEGEMVKKKVIYSRGWKNENHQSGQEKT